MALPPPDCGRRAPEHGGSLAEARRRFPDAHGPWIDLSTGINPHSYPLIDVPANALKRLPEPADIARLTAIASLAYGAGDAAGVVAAPGTQVLLPLVAGLVAPGRAFILGPTYSEHERAAALAGHETRLVTRVEELAAADLAVAVNPNNPDGRLIAADVLTDVAREIGRRRGLLVVDEAFMDVAPPGHSLAPAVDAGNIVVLRSFGKFFGLAGIRLGFAIAGRRIASELSPRLGPWAVSGVAIEYGLRALADREWQGSMRRRLSGEAHALDAVLLGAGLNVEGGTSLFRFVAVRDSETLFEHLGRRGILVRRFSDIDGRLRIGLPSGEAELGRLAAALGQER